MLAQTDDIILRHTIRRHVRGFHAMLGHADEARRLHELGLAEAEDIGVKALIANTESLFPALVETLGWPNPSEVCDARSSAWKRSETKARAQPSPPNSPSSSASSGATTKPNATRRSERVWLRPMISRRKPLPGPRAQGWAHNGDLEHAEVLAREAATIVDRSDDLDSRAWIRMDVAEVLSAAGKGAEARSVLEEAIRLAEMKEDVLLVEQARTRIGQLHDSGGIPIKTEPRQ